MRAPTVLSLIVLVGSLMAPPGVGAAQELALSVHRPRFLYASSTQTRAVEIDPSRNVLLQRVISLNVAQPTVRRLLAALEGQTGLKFIYGDQLLVDRRVALRADSITVAAALTVILLDTGLDVVLSPGRQVAFREAAAGLRQERQGGAVAGRVTDAKTAQGIGGVEVSLEATRWRASTDTSGRYRLAEVTPGSYTLVARRIGYAPERRTVTVTAGQEAPVDVALQPAATRLGDVVVTAQKREERLQEVPMSVSVVAGDQLDRTTAKDVSEMLRRVPGVSTMVAPNFSTTMLTVRGVGAAAFTFFGSSPVAYYLDGAPFGFVKSAIVPDANPFDLDRLEVLRGPQGTLYGASAQNGVVRVLTKDPNLTDWAVKARTSVSSTESGGENYRGDLAINVPLVAEKLAVRAVAGYQSVSGWIDSPIKRGVNDGEVRNIRLKLAAQPTDRLSINASTWVSRGDYGAPSAADEGRRRPVIGDELGASDYNVHGLRVGYKASGFSISSMTSYLDYASDSNLDLGAFVGLPSSLIFSGFDSRVFTEEVLLQSAHGGPWRWSLGGMYRDAEDRLLQLWEDVLPAPTDFTDGSESVAVFGELARRFFNGKLEASFGLRYFHDDVVSKENVQGEGLPDVPLLYNTASFNSTTPRAVLTWYPTGELTVYGSYAEGFRGGFPQNSNTLRVAPDFPPLRPDKLHNYEVGVKGSVWDRRVAFDVALYYIDWQGVQQQSSVLFHGSPIAAQINGVAASGAGVDVGVTTEPAAGLELGANVSWNRLAQDAPVRNLAGVILFDKGDRLQFSPEYTVGTSASYGFPIGTGGFRGRLSASANYVSEQPQRVIITGVSVYAPGEPQLFTRASFSLDAPARWSATIFADNINNEQDAIFGQRTGPLSYQRGRQRPRTIGVQLEYGL